MATAQGRTTFLCEASQRSREASQPWPRGADAWREGELRARHVRRNTAPATMLSRRIASWIRPASRIDSYSPQYFSHQGARQPHPYRPRRAENPQSSPHPTPYTGAACDIASLPSARGSAGSPRRRRSIMRRRTSPTPWWFWCASPRKARHTLSMRRRYGFRTSQRSQASRPLSARSSGRMLRGRRGAAAQLAEQRIVVSWRRRHAGRPASVPKPP